jgi:hypothetical protein
MKNYTRRLKQINHPLLRSLLRYAKPVFILILSLFLASSIDAATLTSVAGGGNWNSAATWVVTSGTDADEIPDADDILIIAQDASITVDVTGTCTSIEWANAGNTVAVSLTINTGVTLTVSGYIKYTIAGTGTGDNKIISVAGTGILNAGSIEMVTTSNSNRDCELDIATGAAVNITGNLIMPGAFDRNHVDMTGSATLKVGGNINNGSGATGGGFTAPTTTPATTTVEFNGSTAQTIFIGGGSAVFGHIIINNANNVSFSEAITLQGDLTNQAAGILASTNTVTLASTANQSIGAFSTTSSVLMTKTGGTATFTGNVSGAALTINGTGGTLNLGAGLSHTFTGLWTRTAGTLNGGSSTISFSQAGAVVSGTGGTFTPNTGTVNYSGVAQTVAALTYTNLTLSGTGAKTFPAGTTTVNGILSIENGNNANTFTGTLAYGSAATLQYNTSSNRTASTEWITPFIATGGVIIANTGIITLNGNKQFGNATNVDLTINNGATLSTSGSNFSLTFHGDFVNNGTLTAGSSSITIASTQTQSIGGFTTTGTVSMTKTAGTATLSGAVSAVALTLNGSGGTLNLGAALVHTVSGAVTRTAGTLDLESSTLTLTQTGSPLPASGGTLTMNTGRIDFGAAGAQTIPALTYYNLKASGSGTKTSGAITVSNELDIASGVVIDMGTNALSGASLITTGAGTLLTQNTTATPVPTGRTWSMAVEYNSASDQTVLAGTYNGGLSATTGGTKTAGALTVSGVLTVATGVILDMSTNALAGASLTTSGTGTLRTQNTGSTPLPSGRSWSMTVEYNSASGQTVMNGDYISLNTTGGDRTLNSSGTISISGTFTKGAGAFTTSGSTVRFNGSSLQSVPVISYNNLTIENSAGASLAGSLTVGGILTLTSGKLAIGANLLTLNGTVASMSSANSLTGSASSELSIGGSGALGSLFFDATTRRTTNAIKHLTISRSGGTVTLGDTLFLKGVMNPAAGTLNTGGFLVVASDASGTGRILSIGSPVVNFTFSGNVTVERFIPGKTTRRWTFVASAIDGVSIRNSWQDDIFITGKGTGGQTCGAGTGNGGGTDRYNDNGFDVTTTNSASMYKYNQDLAARWDSVLTTTSTNLAKGVGYRLLVRGPRSVTNACADQLSTTGTGAVTEATLSATGTLTTGNVLATIQGKTTGTYGYTLLGNPYACEINFDLFYSGNSILLTGRKYWTYDPWSTSTAYLTYVNGAVAGNFGGNIVDSNGFRIASGGAFFVETANSTDGTATFRESMKTDGNQKGAFRTTSLTRLIRVKFKKSDDTQVDDIVIRFSDEAGVSVNETETLDARTMNTTNFLASIKGTRSFAISTRPISFYNDTVMVRVVSATTGDFKLSFHEFQDFSEAAEIILIDSYAGTQTNVKANPVYPFTITSNTASQGGRFLLVFRSQASVLPVTFTAIAATVKAPGVEVEWKVASEQNIASYVVERSENGRDFNAIGTTPSKGSSTSEVVYSFMDLRPVTGIAYYRVKSVDIAGVNKYTAVVKINSSKQASMLSVYPNPVKAQLNLVVSNSETFGKASSVISNVQGKIIQLSYIQGSNGNYKIDVSSLTPGMYFITLTNNNGERLMEKFMKF